LSAHDGPGADGIQYCRTHKRGPHT